MTYEQTLEYIHSPLRFGSKPGLARIRALMEKLGNPQDRVKYVHIAGTNGKGSTTAMTAAVLRAAGYKVGMFVSPYVDDFRERIQVDGELIPKEDLCRQLELLLPCIEAVKEMGFTQPTEFEIVTAIALNYFAEVGCDFVALEVGLGGRLDMTNVIAPPEAAVITSISYDHMKVLGSTLSDIAREKCGIIKPGSAAVCYGEQPEEAMRTIREDCGRKGVPLYIPDQSRLTVLKSGLNGSRIRYDGLELQIPMAGRHQIQNALTVVETMRVLQRRGYPVTDAHIAQGIAGTCFPGRFEIVRNSPLCILDGGHNPDAVRALGKTLDETLGGRRLITVMGMFADKDHAQCIPEIARRSSVFIGTECDYRRALDAREVAREAAPCCGEVYWNENVACAAKLALYMARYDDVILVCGSLYTLHDAKIALTEELNV